MEIELFEHNEQSYQALSTNLKTSNFGFIENATGTGKSFIMIKYLGCDAQGKRILFVTLHEPMAQFFINRDMQSMGVTSDKFEKLDYILYSSINKHSAQWYFDNYDVFIFDEAHHCGAKKWGIVIAELRDLVKNSTTKKMIGLTATGTRYLDNYTNVAKEYFENQVCSRLSIVDAMLQEILPVPYYVNVNFKTSNILEELTRKFRKLNGIPSLVNLEEEVSDVKKNHEEKIDIPTLFKNHDVKVGDKYIVFCSDIKDISIRKKAAQSWFKGVGSITCYECHSKQSKQDNERQIKEFENGTKSDTVQLMFAVDMFNEGLHIKGVDGLIMCRQTTSPIVYLQQLGRALSFSGRKKQIKIFDLVGNASSISIIYELYKDLLHRSKELIKNGDNREYILNIVERFKIIDEGYQELDRLEEINEYLETNYIKKEKAEKLINLLAEYCNIIDNNFMDLLKNHKLKPIYVNAYKKLRELSELLNYEQLVRLNRLGINVCDEQFDEAVLNQIKETGSLIKLKRKIVTDFFEQYNLFYLEHNRRPNPLNDEEKYLYEQYRTYIQSYSRSIIKKILRKSPYKLNLEELILIGEYPSEQEIAEYLEKIAQKYKEGEKIDELENATLKRIKNRQLYDDPILDVAINNVVFVLDRVINEIEKYFENHPGMEHLDKRNFEKDSTIYRNLKYLEDKCEIVTNDQFKKLLQIGIKLPDKINMTYEERLKQLGHYNSFDEMKRVFLAGQINFLINFIKANNRRPLEQIEKDLYKIYDKVMFQRRTAYSKRIIDLLNSLNIPLTHKEKIYYCIKLSNEELNIIYDEFIQVLKGKNIEKFDADYMVKTAKLLKENNVIDEKLSKIYISTIKFIDSIVNNTFSCLNTRGIQNHIANNVAYIPYGLVNYIEQKYNMNLSSLNANKNNEGNNINLLTKKYYKEQEKVNEFFKYLLENRCRPSEDDEIYIYFRKFLTAATYKDRFLYIKKINECSISLTLEELYLIDSLPTRDYETLYNEYAEKVKKGKILDKLAFYVYDRLEEQISLLKLDYSTMTEEHKKIYRQRKLAIEKNKLFPKRINDFNLETKKYFFEKLKKKIEGNPNIKINYKDLILTDEEIEKLENYRNLLLYRIYIQDLIKRMNEESKPYSKLLTQYELIELSKMIDVLKNNAESNLLRELEETNKKVLLESGTINIDDIIAKYVVFIENNASIPCIDSLDSEEVKLAKNYEMVLELLDETKKKKVIELIKSKTKEICSMKFYKKFIEFIEKNNRFPNKDGEDEFEYELATDYLNLKSKLNPEQKKVINKLLLQYGVNAVKYTQNKKIIIEKVHEDISKLLKEHFKINESIKLFPISIDKNNHIYRFEYENTTYIVSTCINTLPTGEYKINKGKLEYQKAIYDIHELLCPSTTLELKRISSENNDVEVFLQEYSVSTKFKDLTKKSPSMLIAEYVVDYLTNYFFNDSLRYTTGIYKQINSSIEKDKNSEISVTSDTTSSEVNVINDITSSDINDSMDSNLNDIDKINNSDTIKSTDVIINDVSSQMIDCPEVIASNIKVGTKVLSLMQDVRCLTGNICDIHTFFTETNSHYNELLKYIMSDEFSIESLDLSQMNYALSQLMQLNFEEIFKKYFEYVDEETKNIILINLNNRKNYLLENLYNFMNEVVNKKIKPIKK